ncbi:MAG: hypothetical protein GX616_03155 [Planctomycetes bacterium]|nr:hypothetical protein [Planctomycetota bacterium]
MNQFNLGLGLAWYLAFVLSTVFHEAAHAFLAYQLGDKTAYHGGQVSLNPAPHIRQEPFGMVVVPVLSFIYGGWMFGWASTPYDPAWAYQNPRRAGLMALGGPGANLLLVLVAALLIRLGIAGGFFAAPDSITFSRVAEAVNPGLPYALATFLSILFTLNLILFLFNLLPLPPLDGSAILPIAMTTESANRFQALMHQPMFAIIGLLIAWQFFGRLFAPVHQLAVNLLYPGLHYR